MAFYDPWLRYFRRVMQISTEEATRWQRFLQFAIALGRHGWRELRKDNATQMAAALTYHTLFGLVPLLVLGLIMFRAFGGFENLGEEITNRTYDYLGISPIAVEAVEPGETPPPTEPPPEDVVEAQTVREVIADLEQRIGQISFAGIGVAGLLVLIWAAIGLLVTIEDAFNQIFAARRGRSWAMRVPIYWAVITLGPVLAGLSLWLTGQVVGWVGDMTFYAPSPVRWFLDTLSRGAAMLATWGLLTLLYVLLPNTAVKLRPALIGALVAAVGWELAKWGFQLYVQNAVTYSVLYGTLGLIPLFLVWLFLSWLIILFGLELTYTLQTLPAHRGEFEEKPDEREMLLDVRWIIPMMAVVGEAFERGKKVTVDELAQNLSLPVSAVTRLGQVLETEGLIHQLDGREEGQLCYSLALPPPRISMGRLLNVGESLTMDRRVMKRLPAHRVLDTLDSVQHEAADKLTLSDVLEDESGEAGRIITGNEKQA